MKSILFTIGFWFSLSVVCFSQADKKSFLTGVQDKISWLTPKDQLLDHIAVMKRLGDNISDPDLNYWTAYAHYLLYFSFDSKIPDERERSEKAVKEGIQLLEGMEDKTSEHYALLSLLGGLELNFTNALSLPFKAFRVKAKAETAIEMNPANPRAHVALGIYDYYTPKKYGGMKIVEPTFLKVLTMKERNDANPYGPTWGQPEAYLYLVRFYRYAKQPEQALQYLDEGLALYPGFELLIKTKKKLETSTN